MEMTQSHTKNSLILGYLLLLLLLMQKHVKHVINVALQSLPGLLQTHAESVCVYSSACV